MKNGRSEAKKIPGDAESCVDHTFLGHFFLNIPLGSAIPRKVVFLGAQTTILQKVRHMNTHSPPGGEFRAKNECLPTWDHLCNLETKSIPKGLIISHI